ncbi:hypothetical protein HanLR1_Chr13g0503831 [Helianthus annuus]|nr:hypothetical protein HanHA89_Chr13g0533731 [Helianthus annuus]KAJ0665429.1 hypothetical protein HanLR1_Chr13g0503831 [Helianthus annuus]
MSKNDNFGAEIVEANDDEDDSIDEDDDKPSRLIGTKSFGCVIVEEKDFMHGFKLREEDVKLPQYKNDDLVLNLIPELISRRLMAQNEIVKSVSS